jgi:hypothetical protein
MMYREYLYSTKYEVSVTCFLVEQPWHCVTKNGFSSSVPDPRIRTTHLRFRILLFSSVTIKVTSKNIFFYVFCILLFKSTFTSLFKGKNVIKKSLSSRNEGFSYYFCLMIDHRRIRIRTYDERIRIREAQKLTNHPDPEHCFFDVVVRYLSCLCRSGSSFPKK